ncbi:hypothetical protein EK904_004263 [Melospiza melodia maxima]|nr:hypothetical protein EK904_004263 [Melospiza melodia maxima]
MLKTISPRPRQKQQDMDLDNVHLVSVLVAHGRASVGQLGCSWPQTDPQEASILLSAMGIYKLSNVTEEIQETTMTDPLETTISFNHPASCFGS